LKSVPKVRTIKVPNKRGEDKRCSRWIDSVSLLKREKPAGGWELRKAVRVSTRRGLGTASTILLEK